MKRPSAKWLMLLPVAAAALAHVDRAQNLAPGDWRSASREAVGLAPDPQVAHEPVLQVYAARTVRWRGYFGVHTWVAAKRAGAPEYTVYEVMGWRLRRGGTAVSVQARQPDERWYGNAPILIAERRGAGVEGLIDRVEAAVADYPYADTYRMWPGPNSNTFTAHVLRAVPELRADLPANAIGKDYIGPAFFAWSPSGTGVQFNLFGMLGAMAGVEEGVEINALGLTFGIDPEDLAVKLPMAGSLSLKNAFDSSD